MKALPDPLSTERLHDPMLPTQSMAPFELPNHGVRVVRDGGRNGLRTLHPHLVPFEIQGGQRGAEHTVKKRAEEGKWRS